MSNPFSLLGKRILITGASSGIGRQCCISMAKQGANIALIGRNQSRLEETIKEMSNPDSHKLFQFDLNCCNEIPNLMQEVVSEIGKLDGLINCAGISIVSPLNIIKASDADSFFKSNVLSGYMLTKEFARNKNHNSEGASVIFISSVMSIVGEKGKSLYCMSKGAINSLVRALALELANKNIRVNSISPGVIVTPINQNAAYLADKELRILTESKHPLGLGNPEDIANGCIYLLSDASRWVTGTNLVIDGGYTAM